MNATDCYTESNRLAILGMLKMKRNSFGNPGWSGGIGILSDAVRFQVINMLMREWEKLVSSVNSNKWTGRSS